MALFKNRMDAGRRLAMDLMKYASNPQVVVLALPRGGVPVAYEVAKALRAPLDIFAVRKLGLPGHEELAMGAIASGGSVVLNQDVVRSLNIPEGVIQQVTERERRELERREQAYRGNRPRPDLAGKIAILVDDGLATGASMHAAVEGLRMQGPRRIIVAAPTAAPETCAEFEGEVDEIICTTTPQPFFGVGLWYEDFSQISDEEVKALLEQAANLPKAQEDED